MQIDKNALEILDRKRARLAGHEGTGNYQLWLRELPGLLRWVLSVPILGAYVKQIVAMHESEEADLDRAVSAAIANLAELAVELREAPAMSPDLEEKWPHPLQWQRFEDALDAARSTSSEEERRMHSGVLAYVLDARANQTWKDAVEARRQGEIGQLVNRVLEATRRHTHRLEARTNDQETSPRTALVRLVDVCRALHPPLDGFPHWTDFLPRDRFKPYIDSQNLKENYAQVYSASMVALDRFIEELHVLGASTLSHRLLVERFKERCTWYDKSRLRDVAEKGKGTREDRLTLELAKYLHDNGMFVLVRPRVSNLEPDVVGLNGLAVEAKAYVHSGTARSDIIHGYYQLHAYMTSLETGAMRVTEGFLVAFRLGGPIYDTPPTIDTGRFLIHSLTIDLGEGPTSGRMQAETARIREEEIYRVLSREPHSLAEHVVGQRLGFAHGITRIRRRRRMP